MGLTVTEHTAFKYLTVAEKDRAWGLYVTGSGRADIPPHTPYPPRIHPEGYMFGWAQGRVLPEFQALYITRGSGTFESRATGPTDVQAGTVLLLFPGEWHRYAPDPETGWKEYWIAFDGSQARALAEHAVFSPEAAVLSVGLNDRLARLYSEVLEQVEAEPVGYKEVAAALTYQILAVVHAVEQQRRFGSPEAARIIQRAQVMLVEGLRDPVNFVELADALGVSYSWFRKHFRRYTGLSPGQYHIQLRINKAKELLTATTLPVQEVAEIAGFASPYYFSRVFKDKVGATPTAWRRYARGEHPEPLP